MLPQETMRQDWDSRARRNAFHYIASWRKDWDLDSFLTSGEEDVKNLVEGALRRCNLPASGKSMIEIGCGAGRMSGSFARRFDRVYAMDLSPEMLALARKVHPDRSNILWLLSNGADLSCIRSGSVDFIFSYLVLQHLPSEQLVFQYVREMLRSLRPEGIFLFQFNGGFVPTMNWRGRLIWSVVDALWSMQLVGASRKTAAIFGLDPEVAGKSWRGPAIPAARIAEVVRSQGGDIRQISGENSPMTWCCGIKKGDA
jgi:SAM-dependent methyltransferase